tara:strand:+ start:3856 stop:4755 length:900 start_codon:yes stop_codon:yes gene_type:complete
MNTLLGYSYQNGGQVSKKLKPIPKDNPGLAKLPQEVRNKMGYMQEGGSVSPALARLLRKRARYDSQLAYEEALREEAKNRERASLFGGFGSLAGSLLLPAITGITGGAALPLIAALGSYGGKKIGSSAGYDGTPRLLSSAESKDYTSVIDDKDLIYGSDAFGDLSRSSRDYTRQGIDQDAIVSGLKTGLLAGFGGSDSIYGKAGSVNLLKEGAGQRFSDLFKQQAMAKTIKPLTTDQANYMVGAEQGMYGELAPFKTSFGLNQQSINPMASGMSRVTPSMVSFNQVGSEPYNLFDFTNI